MSTKREKKKITKEIAIIIHRYRSIYHDDRTCVDRRLYVHVFAASSIAIVITTLLLFSRAYAADLQRSRITRATFVSRASPRPYHIIIITTRSLRRRRRRVGQSTNTTYVQRVTIIILLRARRRENSRCSQWRRSVRNAFLDNAYRIVTSLLSYADRFCSCSV